MIHNWIASWLWTKYSDNNNILQVNVQVGFDDI